MGSRESVLREELPGANDVAIRTMACHRFEEASAEVPVGGRRSGLESCFGLTVRGGGTVSTNRDGQSSSELRRAGGDGASEVRSVSHRFAEDASREETRTRRSELRLRENAWLTGAVEQAR